MSGSLAPHPRRPTNEGREHGEMSSRGPLGADTRAQRPRTRQLVSAAGLRNLGDDNTEVRTRMGGGLTGAEPLVPGFPTDWTS